MNGPDRPPVEEPPHASDDLIERIARGAGELFEFARHYLDAKTDAAKLRARAALIGLCLNAVALLAAAGLLVCAGAMIFTGIAAGLGEWFGGRRWLGDLAAGLLLAGVVVAGIWLRLWRLRQTSLEKTIRKYEQRKQDQRRRFGHDVAGRQAD